MTATYVGKPCKHGHEGLRYASTGGCVTCTKERANKRPYEERKASARRCELKKKYGISKDTYDQMLTDQGGVCAVCQCKPDGKDLAVDHCHTTGKVRGLLCSNCNTALGLFGDDVARMMAARDYLINSIQPI